MSPKAVRCGCRPLVREGERAGAWRAATGYALPGHAIVVSMRVPQ
ncbi:MAG: hypothetical protein ACRDP6_34110 [Actinoallomurus sp.]